MTIAETADNSTTADATTVRARAAGRADATFVFDAYSAWSYGFTPAITGFVTAHADLSIDVVHGVLYTQQRITQVRRLEHLRADCGTVADVTGVEFGQRFLEVLRRGELVIDSGAAAIGFAALRSAAPHLGVELAAAMQVAFFRDGLSLSDTTTYRRLADEHGIDRARVQALLCDRSTRNAARLDAGRCHELGVTEYPTVVVHHHGRSVRIGAWYDSATTLDAAFSGAIGVT